jgi:hypothetical protein
MAIDLITLPDVIVYYTDKTEAAQAYNVAAIKYHGEYARLNLIKSE